jgi:hypothetical protein
MLKCQINVNVWVGKSLSIRLLGDWLTHQRDPSSIQNWGYWIPVIIETGDEIRSEDENNPHLEKKQGFKLSFSGKLVLEAVPVAVLDLHYLLPSLMLIFFIRSMALASL